MERESMPDHEEVAEFTRAVGEHMPEHEVYKEQEVSNVALLSKEEDTWVEKLDPDSEFWAE